MRNGNKDKSFIFARNSLKCRNKDYIIIRSDPKELIFLEIGVKIISLQLSLIMFPCILLLGPLEGGWGKTARSPQGEHVR